MDPIYYTGGLFILGAVVWIVCAWYAYQHAPDFGRTPLNWGILGIVFGPIALMALYVLPKQRGSGSSGSSGKGGHRDPRSDLYEVPKKK